MRGVCFLLVALLLAVPCLAQDREDQWEGASFLSVGSVGLNYSGIQPDVREFVGPAYSFDENGSLMLGFSFNFGGAQGETARLSAFLGGSFKQYIGLGYAFDLYNEDYPPPQKFLPGYKVKHSLLFGALIRHPDLE